MFGWFKKRPPASPEKIFTSRRALLAALDPLLARTGRTQVLVCAFELSLASLAAELTRPCVRLRSGAELARQLGKPESLLATTTGAVEELQWPPGAAPADFLVVERHPLRRHDDSLEEVVRAVPGCTVTFLLSLDDPFFTRLGGDRLKQLCERLGVGDEPLEHTFITKSVRNAQDKLAKSVLSERPARSAEEWYAANGLHQ